MIFHYRKVVFRQDCGSSPASKHCRSRTLSLVVVVVGFSFTCLPKSKQFGVVQPERHSFFANWFDEQFDVFRCVLERIQWDCAVGGDVVDQADTPVGAYDQFYFDSTMLIVFVGVSNLDANHFSGAISTQIGKLSLLADLYV